MERDRLEFDRRVAEKELEHRLKMEELERTPVMANADVAISHSFHALKGPKLPPFEDGKDNMDLYLQRFERYAAAQGWRTKQWAMHLSALLKGKALEAYSRLSPAYRSGVRKAF